MVKRIFRPVSGVLLLDKAINISSNRALQDARFLFQAKKAGHTGTLDPFATGLLPICFGEANKFSRWLLGAEKSYEFTLTLGDKTDTGDIDGEIIASQPIPTLQQVDLERVSKLFTGEITQIPPKYSALRVDGKRAYALARAGEEFEIPARQVFVHKLLLDLTESKQIKGVVTVSKGTYIRVLAEDIAQALGSVGYCAQLRRTQVGVFSKDNPLAVCYADILPLDDNLLALDQYLLPIDSLCNQFPKLSISKQDWQSLVYGRLVENSHASPQKYRLYLGEQFMGLGEVNNHRLKSFRLINTA